MSAHPPEKVLCGNTEVSPMNTKQLALLHARTKIFHIRLESARIIVEKALDLDLRPYVSFSGGKDSTVVFNLVLEQKPDIVGVWSDDEWFLPETLEYVRRMQALCNIHQIRTQTRHAEWFASAGEWLDLPHYAKKQLRCNLTFLGLRQEENSQRKLHLRKFGPLFFAENDDCWHCNPIHNWSVMDVWAFIYSNGLDYNRAYDRLTEIGIPLERQRIGPLAVERVLGYGQLAILKRGWPDLFNRFAEKYPEARGYT